MAAECPSAGCPPARQRSSPSVRRAARGGPPTGHEKRTGARRPAHTHTRKRTTTIRAIYAIYYTTTTAPLLLLPQFTTATTAADDGARRDTRQQQQQRARVGPFVSRRARCVVTRHRRSSLLTSVRSRAPPRRTELRTSPRRIRTRAPSAVGSRSSAVPVAYTRPDVQIIFFSQTVFEAVVFRTQIFFSPRPFRPSTYFGSIWFI